MLKNIFILLLVTAIACAVAFGLTTYQKYAKQKSRGEKLLNMETLSDIILGDDLKILKEENFQLEGFPDVQVEDVLTENYRILKATEEDELSVFVEDLTNEIGYLINNGVLEKIIDLKKENKEITPQEVLYLLKGSKEIN